MCFYTPFLVLCLSSIPIPMSRSPPHLLRHILLINWRFFKLLNIYVQLKIGHRWVTRSWTRLRRSWVLSEECHPSRFCRWFAATAGLMIMIPSSVSWSSPFLVLVTVRGYGRNWMIILIRGSWYPRHESRYECRTLYETMEKWRTFLEQTSSSSSRNPLCTAKVNDFLLMNADGFTLGLEK